MKSWKKYTIGAAVVAVAGLTLVGCSSGKASRSLNIFVNGSLGTLDQSLLQKNSEIQAVANTEEGLVRIDKDGNVANALAKSIDVSSDGLTYTVTLRDGLKWSNGDKLTAKDFVYSYQRGIDPATASPYEGFLEKLKNGSAIYNSGADRSTLGVKAESDTKLVITLESPTPYFEKLLAMPIYFPEDQAVVEKYGKEYGTSSDKMVYSGPFMFKSTNGWTGSGSKSFTIYKNSNYYDASAVKSDSVTVQVIDTGSAPSTAVQLYKSGKLDMADVADPNLYKQYKNNKDTTVRKEATTAYLEFNQSGKGTSSDITAKALQNQNIRQALTLALNRQDLIDQFAPGSAPATGMTPTGLSKTSSGQDFAAFAKQGYTYDPSKAKDLFQKGLQELGVSSLNISLTQDTRSSTSQALADYFKQNFEKNLPGLTITEKLEPYAQRVKDAQSQNFDIVLSLWGADYAEPSTFLDLFKTENPLNNGKVNNSAYQTAITAAEGSDVLNASKVDSDYKDAEAALFAQSSISPLYFRATPQLVNSKVTNLYFHGTGLPYDLKTAYVK